MTEQWQELKETITEMRDNGGTGTQQEVCKFLANYMEILEKQMQQPCEDCISRKDVLAMKRLFIDEDGVMAYAVPTGNILRLQPVTPTRPTARWEKFANDYKKCSRCEELVRSYRNYKYCPNCGSEMIEE